ncbi:MAG: hypothetical protein KAJ37_00760 [Candidatus Krumholzibacteria bacterium]|nr:hypothetical protein [Candidatus Krumholzibacteria bacterium]
MLAGLVGGFPSTLHAIASGGNWLESINAIAAIANAEGLSFGWRVSVAAAIHFTISFVWASALIAILPQRRTLLWASAAGAVVAVVDLLILAPVLIPEIAALPFWPQLADHVVWGVTVGAFAARAVRPAPRGS